MMPGKDFLNRHVLSWRRTHLLYWITQCYLPPYTSEHTTLRLNPSQTGRYSIYLPRRDRRLSWPRRCIWLQQWLSSTLFNFWKIATGLINYRNWATIMHVILLHLFLFVCWLVGCCPKFSGLWRPAPYLWGPVGAGSIMGSLFGWACWTCLNQTL